MGPKAMQEDRTMPPLVTKHFGKEIFTKTQQYDDLATSVTVPRSPITPRHVTKVIHTQFGAANDVIAVLETEEEDDGSGRIHGFLDVLTPDGKKVPAPEPMRVELSFTKPNPDELEIIEEHRKTLIWAIEKMDVGVNSSWGLPKIIEDSIRQTDERPVRGFHTGVNGSGVKRSLSYSANAAAAHRAAIPAAYMELYKRLAAWLEGFRPSDVRVIRSHPVLNEKGKVLVGHVCTNKAMFLHEAQVDIFDVFLHQILELWLPLTHKARPNKSGRTILNLLVPSETPLSSPSSSSEEGTPPMSPEPSFLPSPSLPPFPTNQFCRPRRLELSPHTATDTPSESQEQEDAYDIVSIGIDSLIRGVARPRPEATEPPREEAAVLARLGDPSGKGMMSFLVLRKFVLDGVEFTPAPGVRVLTPESHRESLDPRGFIAFEPHPDDIALFAGAFTSEAKGVVPIHMISCMPDPAGITDQYLADLLALTTFAIDNPNVSSRLVHAKLIGRSVFGDKSEASDAAAKLRGLFTPREQLALANRFKMNFPALDMGEVDRIRSLFTPSEWRRHKRSLRVYEGYLGFQYMGKETDENDYTNMVWDLPLVKGAFSPNGTLLSYWSKYQAPSEKDALKLRQTLRSLKHMGTVVLPAPHHRHPQHRQLTRVAIPLIAEELPHAKIMLYEDLTGFTHLRANMLNCIEGGTGMWMAKVWEAYGSQEARNPYRAMWYNHVRRAALREADVIEQQVKEEKWQHLAERFVVGTLRRLPRQILD